MDWAICHSRPRTAELLLDARADVELRDPDLGSAPLGVCRRLWGGSGSSAC